MIIKLENAGKRFISEWIFRGVNLSFKSGDRTAILGSNGSGKSTLVQIIAGYVSLSEGIFSCDLPEPENLPLNVSFTSPYLELPEDYTLPELLHFHFSLKSPMPGLALQELPALFQLDQSMGKQVKTFSSGMKQRVKLGLAICSHSELLVLDEPFTNLDAAGKKWYTELLERFAANRILLICSNHQPEEYSLCKENVEMESFKNYI